MSIRGNEWRSFSSPTSHLLNCLKFNYLLVLLIGIENLKPQATIRECMCAEAKCSDIADVGEEGDPRKLEEGQLRVIH